MSQMIDPISSEIFERKPYLQNYFKNFSSENHWELLPAKKTGEYYVSLDGNPLSSSFSPLTQATRLVDSYSLKPTDVVILLGLGNPHLISLVSEALAPGQILILIGEDETLIPVMWDQFLKPILKVPGRHLFSGEMFYPLFFNYLESLPIERVSGLKVIRNPTDTNRNPIYKELEEKTQNVFSAKMSDLLTKFEFERLWIKNSIYNLVHAEKKPPEKIPISLLRDKFQGLTAVLVSAGPSLRKNLPWLQEVRDKVFVFSCDTSLKVLIKAGIRADGVVTLDAQTNSFFHFMGESLEEIPLFADLVSSPTLLREPMFQTVVHSVTAKYQVDAEGSLVREVTAGGELAEPVFTEVGDIQSGGSVATTAFDMLRFMGFGTVYFLGQDLAYSGREIHSTGTHHNEKWLTQVNRKNSLERTNEVIIRKRETRFVPSANGKTVLTDYVLDLYRHWFEESATSVKEMSLWNVNEDGAEINGIPSLSPTAAKEKLNSVPNHNYPWRELSIWSTKHKNQIKGTKQKGNIEIGKGEELGFLIRNGSERLFQKIKTDLGFIDSKLNEFEGNLEGSNASESNSPSFQDSEIWLWMQSESYLRRLIRKTEIYLLRHKDLDIKRKNQIMLQSIRKEIRYLKRSLYPMMDSFPEKG
ncbi:PF01973 family protein [Leptospira yanagawae serovar Saopaulo str. Sao Paulo = ATCC 700523]|uniref:PF01973 family protein n=1 Tax=Leptospira yanagawae serovar Saopaulo str. Sao Paulo = ATCC 700523 TaxID=1249483 RepID=A0A5E8HH47_9LEPT|nr:6-hydroxymethylpterin diphosphokinase MptE-like protein [Leptospira yanagawae]EOQ90615.1 PF01973 family protein [Leptospira yanagawae serovar Saopaulo str. Sao Paulo = ATCC 700523]